MPAEDEIKDGNRKWLTELVDVDGLASFPQASFTEGLDLNDVVVVRIEGQLNRGFVGDDGVHVIIPVSSVKHLQMTAPKSIKSFVQNN